MGRNLYISGLPLLPAEHILVIFHFIHIRNLVKHGEVIKAKNLFSLIIPSKSQNMIILGIQYPGIRKAGKGSVLPS